MNPSYLSITSTQQQEFEELGRGFPSGGGYRWLAPNEVPTAIPQPLREKFHDALLIAVPATSGATYLVCNGRRLDFKTGQLDQEPFAIAVSSSGASDTGLFLHHGSWQGRSEPVDPEILATLRASTIGDYYPLGRVPSDSSGPLSDLGETSHVGALDAILSGLKAR